MNRFFALLLVIFVCSAALFGCARTVKPDDHTTNTDLQTTKDNREETVPNDDETDIETQTGENTPINLDHEEKEIDIYFITGQSNATGNSKITDQQAIAAFAPDAIKGFSNILYAGNSRSNGSGTRDRIIDWQPTKIGFGAASNTFGPEVGMAKAFSAYYNDETGKKAGLIKYAYNGASLLNKTTGSTNSDGNWVSPSYLLTLPASEVVAGVTGQMYRNFLQQAETNLSQLLDAGYTKIRICGVYWMQGCSNKNDSLTDYETAFAYLAQDMRTNIAAIMRKLTGTDDDCGALNMRSRNDLANAESFERIGGSSQYRVYQYAERTGEQGRKLLRGR